MRVIAGCAKGHRLQTIEGMETRPTADRIKETLFNIIAFDLPECTFLDLFSGSGAIGIEALSRGAAEAVFVEQSANCQAVIAENLLHTKLQEKAVMIKMDVLSALAQLCAQGKRFDIIFLDPPYEAGLYIPVLKTIAEKKLLHANGVVIAEHRAKAPLPTVDGLYIDREKVYKTTALTFLRLEEVKK